ncbi:MAG: hypothetical protein AAFV53_11570, partial [Myxococcota bacterium]
ARGNLQLGKDVDTADLNGDGLNDVTVDTRAQYEDNMEIFIFYNSTLMSQSASTPLSSQEADAIIYKEFRYDFLHNMEERVQSVGDVNSDGFADLAIAGVTSGFVVFGRSEFSDMEITDADIVIQSGAEGRTLAVGIGNIGDVNGDNHIDLIFGEGTLLPADAVLFYGPFNEPAVYDSSEIEDVRFIGDPESDERYDVMRYLPDVTGDGVNDLLIGSPRHSGFSPDRGGIVYIVEGGRF